jgi:iron complex outermembrane receptor protein/vitamin B12 transporter
MQVKNNGPSLVAAYHVKPIGATRSRTYDIGVDQNIFGERLVFTLGYFHNQFDHQIDYVDASTLNYIICGGHCPVPATVYGAEVNTLAYRAQGIETELEAKPAQHWFVRVGYTYLDAKVEQSFSTDAAYNGKAATNPNLPGVPIGSSYPLVGARPFRRPPHTGFFAASYTRAKFAASLKGAFASRSDDSTFLSYSDVNGDNTLLLPNRNLDFGFTKIDVGATWQFKPRFALFTQMDNLLNDQHIGPIGYPGLPFTARAGVKVRLGGD